MCNYLNENFLLKRGVIPCGLILTADCHSVSGAGYCLKSKFSTGITEGKENLLLITKGPGRPEHSVHPSLAPEIISLLACWAISQCHPYHHDIKWGLRANSTLGSLKTQRQGQVL